MNASLAECKEQLEEVLVCKAEADGDDEGLTMLEQELVQMIESTKTRLVQLKRRRLLSLVNNCGSKIPAAAAASSAATPAATPPHNSRTDGGAGVGAAVGTVGAGLGAGVGVGAFNALLSGAQHKLLPGDEVVP